MKFWNTLKTLALFVTLSSQAVAANDPPEVTVDGLHRVDNTQMALVYAAPGTDLSQYNRIYLIEPKVAFRKNWLRTQNSIPDQTVTTEDMQRIKSELASLFTEVFKQ